ncbi:sulfurtransferase [Pseudonocardia kunmingensis]|uniref:Thiosulfate/3-mercaptopyruvate sulfurtransferase n=1 Tax=Pseudonocardia kunmingensis TaxID=630975 RepID=A0A543DN78_9PSEU|nr:sulfurtransferase [Pseudonocardia kunmingensis]TQM10772.1 thiosulfate/3-mercaptopyruvate sulfurtransferase [Pseudonocardia kunmingensis]
MDPLIAPTVLAELLAVPDPAQRPVVLDVRWRLTGPPARPDHDAAHLPGAVFLDMDSDLADPPGPAGRHPLPSPARLQSALRRAGVRDDSLVVAHDDAQGVQAARTWWLLRWAGFAAGRVAVLDGGYRAWVEAGLPTTDEPSRPLPGDVTVRPGGMPVLDADEAAALARSGVLLDARAPERYRGEFEPVDPKAGHIPGAVNAPATDVLGPDGRWLAPAPLAARLAGLAGPGAGDVGAYCGSGATAAALVLAMEHAGLRPPERPIGLYVGSWSNWSADPGRPVAVGTEQ